MDHSTYDYLAELYKNVGVGHFCVSRLGSAPDTQWFPIADLRTATETMLGLAKDGNTYHGLCLHAASHGPTSRGTNATVSVVPGFILDLDLAAAGDRESRYSAGKNPPASLDEIKGFLSDNGFPNPTAMVATGNGYQGHWWFRTPFLIGNDEDRARAAAVLRGANLHARTAGAERGWIIDNIGDLARITRAPGTWNLKDPAQAKLVSLAEFDPSIRYSFDELEKFAQPTGGPLLKAVGARRGPEENPADFEAVKAGCRFMRRFAEEAADLREPEWYAGLSIVGACKGGDELAQELSSPYDGYSREQTQWYLGRASQYPPRTCASIEHHTSACAACPFRGRIKSPIALGYEKPGVVALAAAYAYDVVGTRAIHWERLDAFPDKSFNALERDKTQGASSALTAYRHTLKVHGVDYLPGAPKLVGTAERRVLNLYRPSAMQPTSGDCADLLAHLDYLFPEAAERGHVLNYLAHLVQEPGIKLAHSLVITGGQGVGKSTFTQWMLPIVGNHNAKTVTNKIAKGDWTAELADKILLIVEEAMGDGRLSTYNDLKVWLSDEQAPANQKYEQVRYARTPRGVIFLTNHLNPFIAEEDDRRLFVARVRAEKQADCYYGHLHDVAAGQLPAFYDFLLRRDLSSFNPKAPPPQSEGKREMILASKPDWVEALEEAFRDRDPPFDRDVGLLMEAFDLLINRLAGCTMPQLKTQLMKMGAQYIDRPIRLKGGTGRLWAWRDGDRWKLATPEELRAEQEGGAVLTRAIF